MKTILESSIRQLLETHLGKLPQIDIVCVPHAERGTWYVTIWHGSRVIWKAWDYDHAAVLDLLDIEVLLIGERIRRRAVRAGA